MPTFARLPRYLVSIDLWTCLPCWLVLLGTLSGCSLTSAVEQPEALPALSSKGQAQSRAAPDAFADYASKPPPDCAEVHACLRRHLPARFDPRRDSAAVKAAEDCLLHDEHVFPDHASCLPFTFGRELATGNDLEVRTPGQSGCVQTEQDSIRVVYANVGETHCSCRGWPRFSHPGLSGHRVYDGCEVNRDDWGERKLSFVWDLARKAPLGVSQSMSLVNIDGEDNPHPPSQELMQRLMGHAPRSVVVIRGADGGGIERLEIIYKEMHDGWMESQRQALERLRDITTDCPVKGAHAQLSWNAGPHVEELRFAADCKLPPLRELLTDLNALPEGRVCTPHALPRPGGIACIDGVPEAHYVALRIGLREVRALEPPLTNVLCSFIKVVLDEAHRGR